MKDREYVLRMIRYCEKINRYMVGIESYEDYASSEQLMDAVALNLEQIGETAKKLTVTARETMTDLEWHKIIGLRNLISHEYEGVSDRIVFEILKKDVPSLRCRLQEFIFEIGE